MNNKNKKRLVSIISLIAGIIIFLIIFWNIGPESMTKIQENAKWIYLAPAFGVAFIGLLIKSLKLKRILDSQGFRVPFWKVVKYEVAGFAISYITPSAKTGGEPLKAYMLKKEEEVPYKTGAASVTVDKFVELLGIIVAGIVGFFVLLLVPEISSSIKITLLSILLVVSFLLFLVYYKTIKGKGPFTSLFKILRFYKIKKFKKFGVFIKKMELKIKEFFEDNKKEFLIAFILYLFFIFLQILEFKFIIMALGVEASIFESFLAVIVFGIAGLIPVPGGIGFQEAGHSGLFALLKGSGSLGLVFSLIVRIRYLILAGIGFTIIAHFGSDKILDKIKEMKNGNDNGKKEKKPSKKRE